VKPELRRAAHESSFNVNALINFTRSSIGKKWIVALTGLAMFLFVIGHLVGNLQVFLGPGAINLYGAMLHAWPELLWVVRSILMACFALHVVFALMLAIENRRARPERYAVNKSVQAKASAKVMALTGILLLGFIVFHLLHFTSHTVKPAYGDFLDAEGRHDVFRMIITGFSNLPMAVFYSVAMFMLCSHLSHGAWSWLQTVGLRTKTLAETSTRGARVASLILALGYISIPAAVFAGYGRGYVAERERIDQMKRLESPAQPVVSPGQPAK
jgi:succinate dehydrogenase / fumarate reductase cytochrome b subunit